MAQKTRKPAGINRNGIRIARPDRHRTSGACGQKDLYRSREQADAHAVYFRLLGTREVLRSYPCPGCGGWHLTKQDAK
jgi:hypothetical protein